jgi:hypothetical protein
MKRWIHSNISVDENKNKKLFATETLTYFIGSSVSRQSGDEAEQAQAHDQVEQHPFQFLSFCTALRCMSCVCALAACVCVFVFVRENFVCVCVCVLK